MTTHYPRPLYSIAEASAIAGCSRETIRLKIKHKKLVASRIERGPWRINAESFEKMIAPLTAIQTAEVPNARDIKRRAMRQLKD